MHIFIHCDLYFRVSVTHYEFMCIFVTLNSLILNCKLLFSINNSTFTSQYPLTTHTTSAISNYNLPTPTVTYFQLTILHLHLSIP